MSPRCEGKEKEGREKKRAEERGTAAEKVRIFATVIQEYLINQGD